MMTYLEAEKARETAEAAAKIVTLPGCKAYPSTGQPAGPDVAWCRAARGKWCGNCQWRKY